MNSIVKARKNLFFNIHIYWTTIGKWIILFLTLKFISKNPLLILSFPIQTFLVPLFPVMPSLVAAATQCHPAHSALDDIIIQTKSCNKIGAHTHTHTHTHTKVGKEREMERGREREITSHVSIYLLINKPCLINQLFYIEIMIKIQEV